MLLFTNSVLNAINLKKVTDTFCMRNGRTEGMWQFYSSLWEKKFKLYVCTRYPDITLVFLHEKFSQKSTKSNHSLAVFPE